ncbi:MAG: glycosyltransferase [Cytophagales bacterium]|nr:glycosyltransferase [Cytophagales bacterium]
MILSIVISYYKNLPNLCLILKALGRQSFLDFEVIVSEDDFNPETTAYLSGLTSQLPFPLHHLQQETDWGFRKNQMLNRSIRQASAPMMVFIDGDCVPHPHFAKAYARHAEEGYMLYGRRVMLAPRFSEQWKQNPENTHPSLIQLLLSGSRKLEEAIYCPGRASHTERGLLGCNWGVHKKHLLAVNGFDENYVKAGAGEDVDIKWRLKWADVRMKSVRNQAIVYHLHHARGYSEAELRENLAYFERKRESRQTRCLNGLEKLIN